VANLIGCGLIIALNLLLKNLSEKETEMKKCFSSTLTILLFLCFVLSLAGCSGSGNSSRNPVAAIYAATGGGLSISTDGGTTFTNYTNADNGLGDDEVKGVYVSGSTIYAATHGGLSISTNGGTAFTNHTTADGLGDDTVNGVYVSGQIIYAATNGGTAFTNYTTANGLGDDIVNGVYVQ
jgi:hypothetical protein